MHPRKFKKPAVMILFIPLFMAVAGLVVMSLWNWLIPTLFSGPSVSFWQALGILLLSKILFGSHGGAGERKHKKGSWDKWRHEAHDRMKHTGDLASEDDQETWEADSDDPAEDEPEQREA